MCEIIGTRSYGDNQGHSKKPIWDRLRDRGQSFRKRPYSPPRRELMANKQLLPKPPRMRGSEANRDKSR
ncbi:hypothetical protein LIER_14678 [Lithospermum erythrorhizon]|uniref:Uncharacterized protein n=1 Tax=Lithospermum erythrorhizon TaxID=34254 RepID=A0AAV3Q1K2_LITER